MLLRIGHSQPRSRGRGDSINLVLRFPDVRPHRTLLTVLDKNWDRDQSQGICFSAASAPGAWTKHLESVLTVNEMLTEAHGLTLTDRCGPF
jgi:hypothetical protein